jgi:hypothetical protein
MTFYPRLPACSFLIAASLLVPAAAFAQFSTGFDSATDYTGNFETRSTTAGTTPADYAFGSAAGVNGGGGLTSATIGGGTALYTGASYNPASGPLTFSIFFKTLATTGGTINNPAAMLGASGVVNTTDAFFGGSTNNVYLAGRVQYTGTGGASDGAYTIQYLGKNTGTTTVTPTAVGSTLTLADATWFKFTFTLERTATTNSFNLGFAVDSYGTTGTDAPTSVFADSVTVTNAAFSQIYGDTSAFAGFRAGSAATAGLDNFSVSSIPEPSTYAAFVGLFALGLAAIRRQRPGVMPLA